MRRFALIAALFLTASTSGCAWLFGTVNADFANSSNKFALEVLPEYKVYLDSDASLDSDDKEIRKGTADAWQTLINEALKSAEDKQE